MMNILNISNKTILFIKIQNFNLIFMIYDEHS